MDVKANTTDVQKNDNNKRKVSHNERKSNMLWTKNHKKILLEALKKYGPTNIEEIGKMLPNISLQDIALKISEYSQMADHVYDSNLLNKWLNCGLYKPGDSLIPQALLFIKLFENHPSISECEGYDFKAIYDFLYRSCLENTSYSDLTPKNRELLCYLLSTIEEKLWPKYQTDVLEYIGKVYNRRKIKKVYPGKRKRFQL